MNEVISNEIVAYNEFRAQLAELRTLNDSTVFDYEDPKGNKAARSHIYKLRKTKTAVDNCRKQEKKASLEYGRKVDSEAKEIISEIEDMISVHQKPIDEIERREEERVATILSKIEEIRGIPETFRGDDASFEILAEITRLDEDHITEEFYQEFIEQAAGAKQMTLDRLREMYINRQRYEAEQAELQRLRAEADAREKKEREKQIAKEAAERAKREAEKKAERERIASEQREQALKDAQERAEREKREAEERAAQAEKNAKEAAVRAAKEAEAKAKRDAEEKQRLEQAERERREANKRHCASINRNAVKAIMTIEGINQKQAKEIVSMIATGNIPNVSIQY